MSETAPRYRLRHPASVNGYIDGAWWPRTRDLMTELPPLLDELDVNGHPVGRVVFDRDYWTASARRIQASGHLVRLGGFSMQEVNVLSLIDNTGSRGRLDLLVIDPDATSDFAAAVLTQASSPANPYRASEILSRAATTNA